MYKTIINICGIEYNLVPTSTTNTISQPAKWEPKRVSSEELYFYINDDSSLTAGIELNRSSDRNRRLFGNYFLTKQQADEAVEHARKLLRLRAYVDEFTPAEWEANWNIRPLNEKCSVYYCHLTKKWSYDRLLNSQDPTAVFMPKSVAEELCRKLNSGEVEL